MKTLQRTLSIIKPDAVERGATGDIINTLLQNGFRIIGMKMLHINKAQAEGFYAVHVHHARSSSRSPISFPAARSLSSRWRRKRPSQITAS